MSDDGRPAGDASSDLGRQGAGPGERPGGEKGPPPARGFRAQPPALKILLVASLTAIAVGVVRCSIELSTVDASISSIGVERALVDLDESTSWAPADSVAARAARLFADALRGAASVEVRLASPGSGGFDAIARLRVSDAEAGIRVAVGVVHASSGRALFETEGEGTPEMLEGLLDGAALKAASALGIAGDSGAGGGRNGGESE